MCELSSLEEELMGFWETRGKKMEAQLKLWATKIDELAASAQSSNGWTRIDLRQRIDDLKVKRALARAKLDDFQAAKGDSRERLMVGLDRLWIDLEEAFKAIKL
jgi:hypothetical protein